MTTRPRCYSVPWMEPTSTRGERRAGGNAGAYPIREHREDADPGGERGNRCATLRRARSERKRDPQDGRTRTQSTRIRKERTGRRRRGVRRREGFCGEGGSERARNGTGERSNAPELEESVAAAVGDGLGIDIRSPETETVDAADIPDVEKKKEEKLHAPQVYNGVDPS